MCTPQCSLGKCGTVTFQTPRTPDPTRTVPRITPERIHADCGASGPHSGARRRGTCVQQSHGVALTACRHRWSVRHRRDGGVNGGLNLSSHILMALSTPFSPIQSGGVVDTWPQRQIGSPKRFFGRTVRGVQSGAAGFEM